MANKREAIVAFVSPSGQFVLCRSFCLLVACAAGDVMLWSVGARRKKKLLHGLVGSILPATDFFPLRLCVADNRQANFVDLSFSSQFTPFDTSAASGCGDHATTKRWRRMQHLFFTFFSFY